jgi:hypothetical protein
MKRWLKNDHRMRADFQALAEKPRHELFIANRKTMARMIAYQRYSQGLPVSGITGHYGASWFWSSYDGQDSIVV